MCYVNFSPSLSLVMGSLLSTAQTSQITHRSHGRYLQTIVTVISPLQSALNAAVLAADVRVCRLQRTAHCLSRPKCLRCAGVHLTQSQPPARGCQWSWWPLPGSWLPALKTSPGVSQLSAQPSWSQVNTGNGGERTQWSWPGSGMQPEADMGKLSPHKNYPSEKPPLHCCYCFFQASQNINYCVPR